MPKQVLTRRRSWTARIAVLAVVFSIFAVALPASAHSVAIDTSTSCPPTTPNAGFTDIGAFGADVQLAINCLVMYGISQGTTATTYSPNGTVLRWQMALFLVRQAADHGLTVPAATNQGYTDIAGLPQATIDAINQVTQLGISKGTSTTTFSPNDPVTRWQMALFLRRLAVAAGVSVTDDPAHNQFSDIGAYTAEIQAAINYLADAHIALGTGGSIYDGNSNVLRWQMALFLTRVLAADGVTPPAGFRVTVTPTDTVTQSAGTARTYSATFKNADGTPYTGAVGVMLRIVSSAGVIDWDGAATMGTTCPDNTTFEAPTDGLLLVASPNTGSPTCGPIIEGFPGSDGIISFTVRHTGGTAERVVPVAWEDLNNDNDAEISGNNAPTEPHGVGGQVAFTATAAPEAAAGAFGPGVVTVKDAGGDRFEIGALSYFYDSNDLFRIEGVATDLAGFEAALNTGDSVTGVYDPDTADQSTFDISTNTSPSLTITDPAAATTVDAATYSIKGTAVAGFTVAVYVDSDNDAVRDAGEPKVAEGTAAADGTWTLVVPLTQNAVNNFVATQRSAPAASDLNTGVDVPAITESAAAAARIMTVNGTNGGVAGILDAGDTLVIDFNENVQTPTAGDSITLLDNDGTRATLTCGTNGTTCTLTDSDTITVVAGTPTIGTAGSDGLLDWVAASTQIESASGYTGTDGLAVDVAASGAGRIVGTTF